MIVDCGSVLSEKKPGLRSLVQEKFTALVQDSDGEHWVTVGAVIRRKGAGQPESIAQVSATERAA